MFTRLSESAIVPRRFLCAHAGAPRGSRRRLRPRGIDFLDAGASGPATSSTLPSSPHRARACCSSRWSIRRRRCRDRPFSVPRDEVVRLYSPYFTLEEIARQDILANEARLRAQRRHASSTRCAISSFAANRIRRYRLSSNADIMAESRTPAAIWRPLWSPAPPPPRLTPQSSPSIGCSMRRRSPGPPSSGLEDIARRLASDLPSRQAGREGSAGSVGVRHQRPAGAPPRGFEAPGAGRGDALRGRARPARAPAHRGALRDPRIFLCAVGPRAAVSAERPALLLRPRKSPRHRRCPNHPRQRRPLRRMPRFRPAAAMSPTSATRICTCTISQPGPTRH